ncbi:TIGR01244 family sulfur transferase [Halocynthiibacter sp. C4]|uniref:TIGR01244 family sulfur transferase n=1 Tax=Halocynthiibacter sp. C4 TaxID=2992758 RepID=UPI00237B69E3|nr:TIGR01244 family sulfur transferase [Halocynthiibacter sp. C4]MDE0590035.1 TIGR01244 family sulfur transferase [Halocynthiibacter sp. C4]
MDIRVITDRYAVSPQIEPGDVAELKDAGFTTVICNRPDPEVPVELQAAAIQAAVEAAGLHFVLNPVVHGQLTQDILDVQGTAIDEASGKCFAYCASGNRSTVVWALANAGRIPTEQIIAAGEAAGYQIEKMRDQLEMLAGG